MVRPPRAAPPLMAPGGGRHGRARRRWGAAGAPARPGGRRSPDLHRAGVPGPGQTSPTSTASASPTTPPRPGCSVACDEPDIVLMDVDLGAEDGLDLTAELRRAAPRPPRRRAHRPRRRARDASGRRRRAPAPCSPRTAPCRTCSTACATPVEASSSSTPGLLRSFWWSSRRPRHRGGAPAGPHPARVARPAPARRRSPGQAHRRRAGHLGPHLPRLRQGPAREARGALAARGGGGRRHPRAGRRSLAAAEAGGTAG